MTRKPDPTPKEDQSEAQAWAEAFDAHQPDPNAGPFTAEESAQLRDLLVYARGTEDDTLFAQIEELAKDPAAYRRAIAGVDLGGTDPEPS